LARRPRQYEAFISYSHAADGALAAQLQRTLNRIARPSYKWWQWWPPRIFRDQTNLAAAGDLTGEIENALRTSDNFVLLASPLAAASPWVDKEAATWRSGTRPGRLFLALTEGTLEWDDERSDFDPARTNALPPALQGAFETEPLWVDFTQVREDRPFAHDLLFLDAAATLAAAIRGVDKDALVGEDVRMRRRARQLAVGVIATVTLLAIAATIAAVLAFIQRERAIDRARLALSRQYAAQSVGALDVDPERSVVLAARAATTSPTEEADSALRRALRTSRLRSIIDVGRRVNDLDAATSASIIAAAAAHGGVRLWNTQTSWERTLGVDVDVLNVALDRDGGRVLGASSGEAVVWSTKELGIPLLWWVKAKDQILSAALSPDGKTAALGHRGGGVRLWRVDTGKLDRVLRPPGPPAPITAVAFSPDGLRVAAAAGPLAAVWDIRRAAPPLVRRHESDVAAVAFAPDGLRLATGDNRGFARVWSLRSRRVTVLIGHEGKVTSVAFAPDGRSLVTGGEDETARIWDLRTGNATAELRGHDSLVLGVAFGRDGETIITGSADRTIRFWAVDPDPVRAVLLQPDGLRVMDVAFDPVADRLVTAGNRAVRIWDLPSGQELHSAPHGAATDDWVESVRFDSAGKVIVSAGDDGTVRIRDGRTGAPRGTLRRAGGLELYDAAISPDGDLVLAGGRDGTARLWRWRDRKVVARLRMPAERVNGVAFSPDGRLLAVGAGRAVRIWRDGSFGLPAIVLRDLSGTALNEVTSVAFSPDGKLVAAGNDSGTWSLWDVRTRARVGRVKAHPDILTDVAFSSDGAYLATTGWDGAVKVWTVPGGNLVTAKRTGRKLEAAAFAPHGRLLAVAGDGGRTTVFECTECRPLDELVCLAAERVTPAVRARQESAFAICD
jgi:WD40 repeat protein